MKRYYWSSKKRDSMCDLSGTLFKMGLDDNYYRSYDFPTIPEMIRGLFNSSEFSISFTESRLEFDTTYYDGTHCTLYLGWIYIYWWY